MKLIYMGTPDFAVTALQALHDEGHEILCVVSQPDKPVGRHAELKHTPVKEKAIELGLPVLQPDKASDPEFIDEIRKMKPDVIVVAAYGKILKKSLLDIPKYGCVNIHGSLLPRWRGAAPIQWAVMSGDKKSGLTSMLMAEGLDSGDILLQSEIELSSEETGGSLFERLQSLSGPLIIETLEKLEKGKLIPKQQDEALVTYAPSLTKEMGKLDFNDSAEMISCRIRGLYPWPGTYTDFGGKMLKIHRAHPENVIVPDGKKDPGCFFAEKKKLFVTCRQGVLELDEVQLEGKKRMSSEDFLLGNRGLFE